MLDEDFVPNKITFKVDSSRDSYPHSDLENSQKRTYKLNKNFTTYCSNHIDKVEVKNENVKILDN